MAEPRCPGQDRRFLRPEDVAEIRCPRCGHLTELWPDEILRTCSGCGQAVANPKFRLNCLEWCAQAADCLNRIRDAREESAKPLRELLEQIVSRVFRGDVSRFRHAEEVLELAEAIGREEGADLWIIVPAALLHDLDVAGDAAAPRTEGTPAERAAEEAAEILRSLRLPDSVVRAITGIIGHSCEPSELSDVNARVIHDAHLIASLKELRSSEALEMFRHEARTEAGRRIGERRLAGRAADADLAPSSERDSAGRKGAPSE